MRPLSYVVSITFTHFYYNYRLSNSVKNDAGVRSSVENASQPSISTKARTVKYDSRRASAPHSAYTTSSNGIAITSNPLPTSAPHSKACTTTSESLPVMQPAVTVEYGGFSEEDESEERQAALSSPIKGKQLLSSSVSNPPMHSRAQLRFIYRV